LCMSGGQVLQETQCCVANFGIAVQQINGNLLHGRFTSAVEGRR
jgi:hypothetical protein